MYATPQEAEEAFYEAFARANLDAMMRVWDEIETIECVHPRGERLQGASAIAQSWRQIFAAGPGISIRVDSQTYTQSATLAVHVVTETIEVDEPETRPARVVATNVYQLSKGGWRMILHHASPAAPPQRSAQTRAQILH